MTVETFFTNFGHLADAPNGVQKLRELILQLAVQGKLVPQDTNDEPASVLLERIRTERKKLIQQKAISKPKSFPAVTVDEIPFAAPLGWEWIRLVDLVTLEYGKNLPAQKRKQSGGIPVYGSNGVVGMHDTALLNVAAIIVGRKGSSGALNISRTPCWPTDVTYFVVPPRDMDFDYCYLLLKSLNLGELGKGIKPGLNRNEAYPLLVPLPPLEEQKRIVAKVDQLMALCDELEARQQKQQQGRVRLNNAALDALLTAREPDEFADHWQRISSNFDLLYDHPETIAKLRAAILQLAVQGKLVPQDPNDEPASVLLERIKAEKAKLVIDKKVRGKTDVAVVKGDDLPIQVPDGWEKVRIGEFSLVQGGKRLPKGTSFSPIPTSQIYIQVTNMKNGTIVSDNLKYISEETFAQINKYIVEKDDLYITIAGTIGDVGEVPDVFHRMSLTENAAKFVFRGIEKNFFLLALRSDQSQSQFREKTKQLAQPKLALKRIADAVIPIPPLEEQKRIVAKVDQLMTLCDELEAKLKQSQQHSEKLMEATVRQLLVA